MASASAAATWLAIWASECSGDCEPCNSLIVVEEARSCDGVTFRSTLWIGKIEVGGVNFRWYWFVEVDCWGKRWGNCWGRGLVTETCSSLRRILLAFPWLLVEFLLEHVLLFIEASLSKGLKK